MIVVAFQGTSIASNPVDALTDIDIIRIPTTLCGNANRHDGCLVHAGSLQAMHDVQRLITVSVDSAIALHPNYELLVTGHSLGGAIAALMATVLRNAGKVVDLVSSDA